MLIDKPEWQGLNADKIFQLCTAFVFENVMNDSPDQFEFVPGTAAKLVGLKADQAVSKVFVQVVLGKSKFSDIQIDVGLKPEALPLEHSCGRDVLAFAQVDNPLISVASREYLAADKISLLLEKGNDRPRDLVHAALLLEEGKYDTAKLVHWL